MMEIIKCGALILLSIGALAVLICAFRTGKPFKTLFLNFLFSVAAVAVIDLTSKFTGVHIAINQWTVSGVAAFGVPAVCGYLLLPFIFK